MSIRPVPEFGDALWASTPNGLARLGKMKKGAILANRPLFRLGGFPGVPQPQRPWRIVFDTTHQHLFIAEFAHMASLGQ